MKAKNHENRNIKKYGEKNKNHRKINKNKLIKKTQKNIMKKKQQKFLK